MKNLSRIALILISVLLFFGLFDFQVFSQEYFYPAEVSGKILDKKGNPFAEPVLVDITAKIFQGADKDGNGQYRDVEFKQNATGVFSWKGQAWKIKILAEKDGYYNDGFYILHPPGSMEGKEIKQNDILIHMIPKGTPSKLEYVGGADIPDKADPKSGGKDCGWSFQKLWYFPVDKEQTIGMTLSFNENGDAVYTMKEPGGFIWYPGYPQFESKPGELSASFEWMTEAPETGYVPTFTPIDHQYRRNVGQDIYCYFRTTEGKYGKMVFHGLFSYYLQPDGSRNLEAGEVVETGPIRPEYKARLEKEQRGY